MHRADTTTARIDSTHEQSCFMLFVLVIISLFSGPVGV